MSGGAPPALGELHRRVRRDGGEVGPAVLLAAAALLAALTAGCGGADAELRVRDTAVVVASTAPFATRPDLGPRIESTLDAALRYWAGSWDQLRGKTLTLEDARLECPGLGLATGCFDGRAIRVATRDVAATFSCVEQTALVHEVGHAVIGDADHLDPRWMDFTALSEDLAGRTGYGEGGEAPCAIQVSVWRHPPAR